ncbi:MAG TPA: DUF3147 family protein [Gemmatimonadota bacterium]|nr:DUF3147 family protein [Gemmatimonadota bacterium]
MFYVIKLVLSAALIVLVSELAKRSSFFGGLVASVPFVSLLAMIWLYVETGDTSEVASLSRSIFWLVLPSLSLFAILPVLLRNHVGFYMALALSTTVMLGCYGLLLAILGRVGIRL